jgi:hypothetical protein
MIIDGAFLNHQNKLYIFTYSNLCYVSQIPGKLHPIWALFNYVYSGVHLPDPTTLHYFVSNHMRLLCLAAVRAPIGRLRWRWHRCPHETCRTSVPPPPQSSHRSPQLLPDQHQPRQEFSASPYLLLPKVSTNMDSVEPMLWVRHNLQFGGGAQ